MYLIESTFQNVLCLVRWGNFFIRKSALKKISTLISTSNRIFFFLKKKISNRIKLCTHIHLAEFGSREILTFEIKMIY